MSSAMTIGNVTSNAEAHMRRATPSPARTGLRNGSKTGNRWRNSMNAFLTKTNKAVHDAGGCLAAAMA